MITGLSKDIPTPNQLNLIRKEMGMTQAALAVALGLSRNTVTVHAWEHGDTKPTATQWAAIRYLYACFLLADAGSVTFRGADWDFVKGSLPKDIIG